MLEPSETPALAGTKQRSNRPVLSAVLNLVLILFLASGAVSLVSDSIFLLWGRSDLLPLAGLLSALMLLAGLATYVLLALIPGIPKRFFLPVSLYLPVSGVAVLPLLVFFHTHLALIAWLVSLSQVVVGWLILRALQGGSRICWPLFPMARIPEKGFRWGNLIGVTATGFLIILPALLLYTVVTAKLAVDHFSDGFVALRPSGISMQVRKYSRDDGRMITLVPMSHVGAPDFYQKLAASFPTDSVVLMEGVTDKSKVVNTHSDYSKMAAVIGGVEQTKVFKPQGEIVAADVDMSSFAPETVEMLKSAMLIHAKGFTPETLSKMMKWTTPEMEKRLMHDILTRRNQHLLGVIRDRLANPAEIIVPWGAAHMPEIAREIHKLGFRVIETKDYTAIRFGS